MLIYLTKFRDSKHSYSPLCSQRYTEKSIIVIILGSWREDWKEKQDSKLSRAISIGEETREDTSQVVGEEEQSKHTW